MLRNNPYRMNENNIHPLLCTLVAFTMTVRQPWHSKTF